MLLEELFARLDRRRTTQQGSECQGLVIVRRLKELNDVKREKQIDMPGARRLDQRSDEIAIFHQDRHP